ncbi:MAG TPA: hypothetical protein V6D12_19840 [Candidatus Obscuribacterales bacterium]
MPRISNAVELSRLSRACCLVGICFLSAWYGYWLDVPRCRHRSKVEGVVSPHRVGDRTTDLTPLGIHPPMVSQRFSMAIIKNAVEYMG